MLSHLTIKNFGLIEDLSIDFHKKLNILTGETGAGKSIIIDALRIVLGDRISTTQIRNRSENLCIEAVFHIHQNELRSHDLFQNYLEPDEPELILQRIFQPDGRNKVKVNGQSLTISQLKQIGNHLIDFHGPHDHQMLLSADRHIQLLDRLIDFELYLFEYQEEFNTYSFLQKEHAEIQKLKATRARELDYLKAQLSELEQIKLDEEAYIQLKDAQTKINNAEEILSQVNHILHLLNDHTQSCGENIRQSFTPFKKLTHLDNNTAPYLNSIEEIQALNDDLILELQNYASSLSFDSISADEINALSDRYELVLKKYGPTISDAKNYYQEAKSKFDILQNLDHSDHDIQIRIKTTKSNLKKLAGDITQKRKQTAQILKKSIEKELKELGIHHVRFEARIEPTDYHEKGCDQVTFYISPNAGEELKPLSEIVSSGEAARVMLALKKALIQVDPVPVLIFDEVDAQIGGRLGQTIGKKLKQIAGKRQVILITHLPQIASFADLHIKVVKAVKKGRSLTNVLILNKSERIQELAQMMSGECETAIALEHAQDLLTQANS